jgi:H+/Cl- antiporter ClcA
MRPSPEVLRWRRRGTILLITGVLCALIVFTLVYLGATYQGLDYKCWTAGPRSPLAEISEDPAVVTGSFSYWPIGRECEWRRAGGDGTVVVPSDWAGTGAVLLPLLIALGGLFLIGLRRFRKQDSYHGPETSLPG